MALATSRPTDPPKFFEGWTEYLRPWAGYGDISFCRALADNYDGLFRPAFNQKRKVRDNLALANQGDPGLAGVLADLNMQLKMVRVRTAFPWVTPVIGSGCLSAPEGPEADAIQCVPEQLAVAAQGWGLLPDGGAKGDAACAFARALLASKLGITTWTTQMANASTTSSIDRTVAARAALCAHLLAQLYFEVGALGEQPLGSVTSPMTLDASEATTSIGAEVAERLVIPLVSQLQALKTSLEGRPGEDLMFVSTFADAVRHDLSHDQDRPQVRGADAQLMAEITWHFMTEGTSQYPGWSALLVLLGFAFNSQDRKARLPHLTDLGAARDRLATEFEETTTESWESRLSPLGQTDGGRQSKRDALYDSVANLLVAQAGLSTAATSRDTSTYPPAVAFVTSFDLELEMALLAKRAAFRLVMPFYVHRSASEASGYVWLHTVVVPPQDGEDLAADDLDRLLKPAEWSLLVAHASKNAVLHGLPSVVRLAGSPLVQGPDLNATPGSWVDKLRRQLGDGVTLAGTVLLDEHTALQQWAADFGTPLDASDTTHRLGLPERFVKGVSDTTDARFWFLLGVQLNDDAIRQRTAALVGAADLHEALSSHARTNRLRRAGVVVNRRSTASQRDVFLWQGLDVVEASYEDVVGALNHAAKHAAQPDLRRVKGEPCAVGNPE